MARTGYPSSSTARTACSVPGGLGDRSGGRPRDDPVPRPRGPSRAAVDGLFLECHDDPDHALSDGPNNLDLKDLPKLVKDVLAIRRAARAGVGRASRALSALPRPAMMGTAWLRRR